jgi:hypothetical protein
MPAYSGLFAMGPAPNGLGYGENFELGQRTVRCDIITISFQYPQVSNRKNAMSL